MGVEMEKISKYIVLALIGSSCFIALIIYNSIIVPGLDPVSASSSDSDDGFGIDENAKGRDEPLEEVHNIDLEIDFLHQSTKSWTNFSLYNKDTSVLDALEEKCTVEVEQYSYGILVVEIDGERGGWVYEVNGVRPGISAAEYYLSDGDEIEWIQLN